MDIIYKGVELTVDGLYTEGIITGYFEEDIHAEYEVYEVYVENTDITNLLNMDQIADIELLILEQL